MKSPSYKVVSDHDPTALSERYFYTLEEAQAWVKELIQKAWAETADNEGKVPNWITEVQILKVLFDVELEYPGELVMKEVK